MISSLGTSQRRPDRRSTGPGAIRVAAGSTRR